MTQKEGGEIRGVGRKEKGNLQTNMHFNVSDRPVSSETIFFVLRV
jgi:hypothetical protein